MHDRVSDRPRGGDPGDARDPRCRGLRGEGLRADRRGSGAGGPACRAAGDVRAALPVERLGTGGRRLRRLGRLLGAAVGEQRRRAGPAHAADRRRRPPPSDPCRDRRERARARTAGHALQRDAHVQRGRPPAPPASQADADPARAAVPRDRRRGRPRRGRDDRRPDRRADLLGEPDAARTLADLPRRPADLGGTDRGRHRELAG